MPACPNCSHAIETLEGMVTQEKHESRLAAKAAENKALGDEVTRLKTVTQGHDAIVAERDKFKGQYEALVTRGERSSAMSENGLSSEIQEYAEMFFAAYDGEHTFSEWLADEGKSHPMLADKYGTPAETPPADAAAAGTPPVAVSPPIPSISAGASTPPGPGGKMTPQDLQAYFQSDTFQRMTSVEQKAREGELREQVANQRSA